MGFKHFKIKEQKRYVILKRKMDSSNKLFSNSPYFEGISMIGDKELILDFEKTRNLESFFLRFKDIGNVLADYPIYTSKGYEYFGFPSLVLVPKEGICKSKIFDIAGGHFVESFGEFYLFKYDTDEIVLDKIEELESSDFIKAVDYNFSSYKEIPPEDQRNLYGIIPGTLKPFPSQKAYPIIGLPKLKKKLGKPIIKIAIFDSGVDIEHYDLEFPAKNQAHWDAVQNDNTPMPKNNDPHGTMCAGLAVGYAKQNDYGINGVGSGCSLVSYRVGFTGNTKTGYRKEFKINLFSLLQSFYKATFITGVDVINCSWGLGETFDTLEYLLDKIKNRGRNGLGLPVVFSAGNRSEEVTFPANSKNVITVGAVDLDKCPVQEHTHFEKYGWSSNFGDSVDLCAVGTDLITTDILEHYGWATEYENDFNYLEFQGTSAAAPLVSGAIGVILSCDPNLSYNEVKSILIQSCSKFSQRPKNGYGHGVLNIHNALTKINNQKSNGKQLFYNN